MNMKSRRRIPSTTISAIPLTLVFEYVYRVPVEGSTNMEVYATNSHTLPEDFETHLQALEPGELKDMMEMVSENMTEYQGGGSDPYR